MRKQIEKIILDEVKSCLAEHDIEHEVDLLVDKVRVNKKVKEIIDQQITEKVTDIINHAIIKAIHKHVPIIDASIAGNVQGLMYGFDSYLKTKSHVPPKR